MHQGTNAAEFPAAHHRLLSLSVTGGFLDGLQLNFSDGLNCIIGGRGTGKTTVLEFIRYLLSSDDPSERSKANKEVVEENLKSGKVVLDIETQSGVPYRIERSLGETAALFNAKGEVCAAGLKFPNTLRLGTPFRLYWLTPLAEFCLMFFLVPQE